MTGGDETVHILRELQKDGFTDEDFRNMHHMLDFGHFVSSPWS